MNSICLGQDFNDRNNIDYHWDSANQQAFLEHLAELGSVTQAARHVNMSPRSAYNLRHRADGVAFRLGWQAAILLARGRLADDLLDRAIYGHEEETLRCETGYDGRVKTIRRKFDARLGMAVLSRLDRMAEEAASKTGETQLVQIIAGDFDRFLTFLPLINHIWERQDADKELAEGLDEDNRPDDATMIATALADYLRGRMAQVNPLNMLINEIENQCELAQKCVGCDDDSEEDSPLPSPEEQAAYMSIWYDEKTGSHRTDFPPPPGFDGDEDSIFGYPYYHRSLTDAEEAAYAALPQVDDPSLTALRSCGEAARLRFLGMEAR